MKRTPISTGKCWSSAVLMAAEMSGKETGAVASPGKPPPMSSRVIVWPARAPSLNTPRATAMASEKAVASKQPLPTWKLTPTTSTSRARACCSSGAASDAGTPNFLPSCAGRGVRIVRGSRGTADLANGLAVVRMHADHELGARVDGLDLVEFVFVVEGHQLNAVFHCKTYVVRRLAGVGVDDFLGVHAEAEHGLHLNEAGAVEAGAQRGERLEDHGVAVALDGVEGLDARQGLVPGNMLAVDIADIEKEEGLLLGGRGGKRL